jgi:hypothetical protein
VLRRQDRTNCTSFPSFLLACYEIPVRFRPYPSTESTSSRSKLSSAQLRFSSSHNELPRWTSAGDSCSPRTEMGLHCTCRLCWTRLMIICADIEILCLEPQRLQVDVVLHAFRLWIRLLFHTAFTGCVRHRYHYCCQLGRLWQMVIDCGTDPEHRLEHHQIRLLHLYLAVLDQHHLRAYPSPSHHEPG